MTAGNQTPSSDPVPRSVHLELAPPDLGSLARVRRSIASIAERHDAARLSLIANEIISNILEHPRSPASRITVGLKREPGAYSLDIADDSSPFMDFAEKCRLSMARAETAAPAERGNGLTLVMKSAADVSYTPATLSADGKNHFSASAPASPGGSASSSGQGKKISGDSSKTPIFVVDDDDVFREMTVAALREKYNPISFGQAQDALAVFEDLQPALVISDLIMPGMDGMSFRRALSELKNGNTTPFIFLTGHADAVEASYINQMGIDDFLHKPINREKLLAVLERLISRSSQVRAHVTGQVGQDITSALRPHLPPTLKNWRTEVRNTMAEAGGGDCVLSAETRDGASIVLADVMGHGIGAKFFAYAYIGYLRSIFYILWIFNKPGEFLKRLSDCVNRDPFLESRVITCLALWLLPDGTATLASAGHPWPILLHKGKARTIEVNGPLPGLIGDSNYPTTTLQLEPGDRLALYTDGVLDRLDGRKNHAVALKRIEENLSQTALLPLDKATDILWGKVQKQAPDGKNVDDDQTLVILEYQGQVKEAK